ncbi:MAG: hypothetical protein M1829_004996 [Trizodia sp. TS-e1964]|nr:MAG: hypothetical protein M1829_004996 [Trizodia sp. TS-e1964]
MSALFNFLPPQPPGAYLTQVHQRSRPAPAEPASFPCAVPPPPARPFVVVKPASKPGPRSSSNNGASSTLSGGDTKPDDTNNSNTARNSTSSNGPPARASEGADSNAEANADADAAALGHNGTAGAHDESSLIGVHALFASVVKPTDFSLTHLSALNVSLTADVELEDLIPRSAIVSDDSTTPHQFLPPPPPASAPSATSGEEDASSPAAPPWPTHQRLSNGNVVPSYAIYLSKVAELRIENEPAFRVVERCEPLPGTTAPKLGTFYKFWNGLARVAQYWEAEQPQQQPQQQQQQQLDTEMDDSSASAAASTATDAVAGAVVDADADVGLAVAEREAEQEQPPADSVGASSTVVILEERREKFDKRRKKNGSSFGNSADYVQTDGEDAIMFDAPYITSTYTPPLQEEEIYKGRRIGLPADMPEPYRFETVNSFVENIAWLFNCHVQSPRIRPRVVLLTTLHEVRLTSFIYQSATTRAAARAGLVHGPLFGIQCRGMTTFRSSKDAPGQGHGEVLDLLREVGASLIVAQDRAKEGKSETRPGEGKWWATAPRWGGGEGGEIGGDGNIDEGRRLRGKREASLDSYRRLALAASTWDSKVRYQAMGKVPGADVDYIFIVSSINHHMAVLRVRVSSAYLAFLNHGTEPPAGTAEGWETLEVRRSRWWDLFRAEDRVLAMRGVWGVLAYLMRAQEEPVAEN